MSFSLSTPSLNSQEQNQEKNVSLEIPSELKEKTIGEIVTEWDNEIQNQTREYKKLSSDVCEMDKQILENETKIQSMKQETNKAMNAQNTLETTLEQITKQQKEMEKALGELESRIEMKMNEQPTVYDKEREQAYKEVEEKKRKIDTLTDTLKMEEKKLT
eukprot:GHVR01122771.1.p1 GENE.GHVR01122771.1~~GHVR01122771.1.p1  ORF type:complete len:160 (+),score=46.19 GHVR01122771.1:1084-1563(+)